MKSTPQLYWQFFLFSELHPAVLYNILKARQAVFVIEQQCLFPDIDGKDELAFHLVGSSDREGKEVQAYARIFLPGVLHESASIGRILTVESVRGTGTGKEVVKRAVRFISEHNSASSIRIAAQQHLVPFYEQFGFKSISSPYLDDGIWHIDMMRWPV